MQRKQDYIVLLHGIFRSSKHMAKLDGYCSDNGYKTINIDYPSTKFDLMSLAALIWRQIQDQIDDEGTINFVGYSMGGLLVRIILNKYKVRNLGKIVMIGTPNKGSEVADFLKNNRLYKKFLGPAGQQLITDQSGLQFIVGSMPYEIGGIAGSVCIYPLGALLVQGRNDGVVSVENTKLAGMKDHIIVPYPHFYLPYSKQVHKLTLNFLRYGRFEAKDIE